MKKTIIQLLIFLAQAKAARRSPMCKAQEICGISELWAHSQTVNVAYMHFKNLLNGMVEKTRGAQSF